MKTMTCEQLGGACGVKFQANSFDEMAEMSKQHCGEMFKKGDAAHLQAMEDMKQLMKTPELCNKWFNEKKVEFEELKND